MQSLAADFRLTFQSRKVELIKIKEGPVRTKYQKAFDHLGQ